MQHFVSARLLKKRIAELAFELSQDYEGQNLVVVGVLNGSFILMADLIRALYTHHIDPVVDFIQARSYTGTQPRDTLTTYVDLSVSITNQHVLLVDDIVDTGRTITHVKERLQQHDPSSLKVLSLIYRDTRGSLFTAPEYFGYLLRDGFVVGYGMDLDDKMRGANELRTTER
jgi:hypoxanthine phosphoribosyltransferase|tara:strand:- start:40477 stop:40992 length:516 start_codon:yes stop_codon:yes gene_type:complete